MRCGAHEKAGLLMQMFCYSVCTNVATTKRDVAMFEIGTVARQNLLWSCCAGKMCNIQKKENKSETMPFRSDRMSDLWEYSDAYIVL